MKSDTNLKNNLSSSIGESAFIPIDDATFEIIQNVSYVLAAINAIITITAVIGNALVLYAAQRNRNNGSLKYFDSVIKSLAVNDLIYGLIGIPCRTLNRLNEMWFLYEGK